MVHLKVVQAPIDDFGKKIVRISRDLMEEYGFKKGEIIEVIGEKRTGAKVYPIGEKNRKLLSGLKLHEDSYVEGFIMMDGLTRASIAASLESVVRIDKSVSKPAKKIVIAPVDERSDPENMEIDFSPIYGQPFSTYDFLVLPTIAESKTLVEETLKEDDILKVQEEEFTQVTPNGVSAKSKPVHIALATDAVNSILGETRFVVLDMVPPGIVVATAETEFEVIKPPTKKIVSRSAKITYDDFGGYKRQLRRLHELIALPLQNPEFFKQLNIDFPRGVIISGVSGVGKTLLAEAIANETGVYVVKIEPSEVISSNVDESERRIKKYFKEAVINAPSLIIVDNITTIAPRRDPMIVGELTRRITSEFIFQIDQLPKDVPVFIIATTNKPEDVDPGFRRADRLEVEVTLTPPDKTEREEILAIKTRGVPLDSSVDLYELAERTKRFTGADLNRLVKEAALAAMSRLLPSIDFSKGIPKTIITSLRITKENFEEAFKHLEPSAMKEFSMDIPEITWHDIGGLTEVKQKLIEAVEWPLKYPDIFIEMGITPPSGVLLYGPPGTGKTLLAKAIANASDSNFIAVRGPELLSKWVGESEKAVREVFRLARQNAPSVIFFDEIDALVRTRGSSGSENWMDSLINQLLSSMDGIDRKGKILVIGATNRPDALDPAIMRPGRFDRLIYVPMPDEETRFAILKVHTQFMPLDEDVDLSEIAKKTKYYVGADLENLCREAAIIAMREDLFKRKVSMRHFLKALEGTDPTMSPELDNYYNELSKHLRGNITAKVSRNTRDLFA